MNTVLHEVVEATPERLTAILRREGVLPRGRVREVRAEGNPAFNSRTWHLALSYDPPGGAAPGRLLLKGNVREAWAVRAGRREVAFYDLARSLPDHPEVLARAFDTAFDEASGDSHVLLQDVSDTHEVALPRDLQLTPGQNVPPDRALFACVTALARLHAFWWQHPLLGGDVIERPTWCGSAAALAREVERRRRAFERLRDEDGDTIEPRLLPLYEKVFARLLPMWTAHLLPRWHSGRHLTLLHDDAYPANFFVPKPGVSGETLITDWQGYAAWISVWDVVTLCATFWTREQREHEGRERRVLEHYHATLTAAGVTGYTWDDLVTDYRLGLVAWLLQPLQDRLDGAGRSYWLPKMTCLADAFGDWQADTLFGSA